MFDVKKARRIYRKWVLPIRRFPFVCRANLKSRSLDGSTSIFIFCAARSGSTWLAEIISTLPGYHMIFEPLNPRLNPESREYGLSWNHYLSADDEDRILEEYLRSLTRGRGLNSRILNPKKRTGIQPIRGYVVKFTYAVYLLGWALQHFSNRTLLMIRHPCAVVSSKLSHGEWSHLPPAPPELPDGLLADHPVLTELSSRVTSLETRLAFEWVKGTLASLPYCSHENVYLTTYEKLVTEGENELEVIFRHLDEPVPDGALEQLGTASTTTSTTSNVKKGKDPLSGWKDRLSKKQIDSIMKMVDLAGIGFYSRDLQPDYDELKNWIDRNSNEVQ